MPAERFERSTAALRVQRSATELNGASMACRHAGVPLPVNVNSTSTHPYQGDLLYFSLQTSMCGFAMGQQRMAMSLDLPQKPSSELSAPLPFPTMLHGSQALT